MNTNTIVPGTMMMAQQCQENSAFVPGHTFADMTHVPAIQPGTNMPGTAGTAGMTGQFVPAVNMCPPGSDPAYGSIFSQGVPVPSLTDNHYCTLRKNQVLFDVIHRFSVRDKRHLFSVIRNAQIPVTADTFFPQYGFTAGEFSTFIVLTENQRKKKASQTSHV